MPVLVKLLANLTKQFRELSRRQPQLIRVFGLQPLGQSARRALDRFNPRFENSGQSKLMFTGQSTDKFQNLLAQSCNVRFLPSCNVRILSMRGTDDGNADERKSS